MFLFSLDVDQPHSVLSDRFRTMRPTATVTVLIPRLAVQPSISSRSQAW